jgi:hypothetical protein
MFQVNNNFQKTNTEGYNNHLCLIWMKKLNSQEKYSIQNVSIVLRNYEHKYFQSVIKFIRTHFFQSN